jgi:hypothetical protein
MDMDHLQMRVAQLALMTDVVSVEVWMGAIMDSVKRLNEGQVKAKVVGEAMTRHLKVRSGIRTKDSLYLDLKLRVLEAAEKERISLI